MRHGSTRLASLVLLVSSGISFSSVAGEESSLPNSMLGVRVTPLLLLSRADVRADLNLSSEQTQSAERAIQSLHQQAQSLRKKPDNAETKRARRAIDDEAFRWINTRLTPEQNARLAQIDLQWEGPSALVKRKAVAEDLHLDHEQIAKLKLAVQRHDDAQKKGHASADEVLAEVALSTLSEAQRETWKSMLGAPLAFKNSKP